MNMFLFYDSIVPKMTLETAWQPDVSREVFWQLGQVPRLLPSGALVSPPSQLL